MRERIVVFPDPGSLARALAAEVVELAAGPERVALALSGGKTPRLLYEILANLPVRWDRVVLFLTDERAVPPDSPDSNFRMIREALLSRVKVEAHPMDAVQGDAAGYEKLLEERTPRRRGQVPALDWVLLGLGSDGHTASLFPGTAALAERERLVVMNEVPRLQTRRMTLTYPALDAAERCAVLVTGAEKAAIVKDCLEGPDEPRHPVLGVRPAGERVFWLDEDAASRLERPRVPMERALSSGARSHP